MENIKLNDYQKKIIRDYADPLGNGQYDTFFNQVYTQDNRNELSGISIFLINTLGQDFYHSLTRIPPYAFFSYIYLKEILIPNSVTEICRRCFAFCQNLQKITFEENSHINTIEANSFIYCRGLKNIDIPEPCETIGVGPFLQTNVEIISLPKTIKFLDDSALASNTLAQEFTVKYDGTKDEWRAIRKHDEWRNKDIMTTVLCTDGSIVYRAVKKD